MFAAIYVPDFPVEAIVRAEPELREQAVAVVEGTPPLVHVVAVNERAAQAGVEPGMTKLEAESIIASLGSTVRRESQVSSYRRQSSAGEGARSFQYSEEIECRRGEAPGPAKNSKSRSAAPVAGTIRQRSREREAAAHAALLDCACGFSPRVEDTAADTVTLDLAGLERIFGAPAKIARDAARRCSEMGLEANVAVASNADSAVLAARGFAGVTVIAEGKEAERLGELGVEILVAANWGKSLPIEESVTGLVAGPISAVSRISTREGACATRALEILETLERWGVRNLRALAALPEVALAERLGPEGLRLQKLARGQTRRPLVVTEPPLVFEEAAELEYPVEMLEPLAFLLNHMLEQLCARLATRALATNELKLQFELEMAADIENPPQRHGDTEETGEKDIADCRLSIADCQDLESSLTCKPGAPAQNGKSSVSPCLRGESKFSRTLRLPVPMLDAKVFLKLLQLDLQAHPPQAPVTKIWLRAEPAEPRRTQNGLFVPEAPEAEKLELTIARIKKVVGEEKQKHCRLPIVDCRVQESGEKDRGSEIENRQSSSGVRVGSPEILDTHRQDGFRMKPFAPATASAAPVSEPGTRVKDPCHTITGSPGEAPGPTPIHPGNGTREGACATPACATTALRVFRPALAAVVAMKDGQPAHVASPERPTMRGEVVWCAGPWRSSGEWWTEQAWSREEWDVALRNEEGVALYRIYRDDIGGKWWVEGSYD